ncbi:hypothetical protein C6946_04165 [Burkholderia thailandensis]|nr:hypothetical protein C6946_04165 [Burkholderia thailandensis]
MVFRLASVGALATSCNARLARAFEPSLHFFLSEPHAGSTSTTSMSWMLPTSAEIFNAGFLSRRWQRCLRIGARRSALDADPMKMSAS